MFICESEAFMKTKISSVVEIAASEKRDASCIIRPIGLIFRPMVPYFSARREDIGRESSEKYQVSGPRVAGSDWLVHKPTEHAFASRVRVKDRRPRQVADDWPRATGLAFQFL